MKGGKIEEIVGDTQEDDEMSVKEDELNHFGDDE